jgi:hypothetical protein
MQRKREGRGEREGKIEEEGEGGEERKGRKGREEVRGVHQTSGLAPLQKILRAPLLIEALCRPPSQSEAPTD